MGWIGESVDSVKSINIRQSLFQLITLGMIVSSALMMWKGLMCITGSESPVVVVLSESMEPGFKRGDILFLHMSKEPIRAGEIVVFNIQGREIPIVHRVIEVHERQETGEVDILTKGSCLNIGWATIIMTEKPIIKYIIISLLGLLIVTSKDEGYKLSSPKT